MDLNYNKQINECPVCEAKWLMYMPSASRKQVHYHNILENNWPNLSFEEKFEICIEHAIYYVIETDYLDYIDESVELLNKILKKNNINKHIYFNILSFIHTDKFIEFHKPYFINYFLGNSNKYLLDFYSKLYPDRFYDDDCEPIPDL